MAIRAILVIFLVSLTSLSHGELSSSCEDSGDASLLECGSSRGGSEPLASTLRLRIMMNTNTIVGFKALTNIFVGRILDRT